ncbi:MAG: glucokinase [Gammaproteobacteria bacterium]|nr:MAG: glucokinase [Gammaproteobacteria bacterium]
MKLLAGDIGGTNSRLMLVDSTNDDMQIDVQLTFPSEEFADLLPIVEAFLEQIDPDTQIDAACFAIAGPVRDDSAQVTNLPWRLRKAALAQALNIQNLSLINDFQAIGYGIGRLNESDYSVIQAGQPETHGRCALIGAGTGLGQAMLIWQDGHYVPWPTEGGHADFAPRDELEVELWRYLHDKYGFVNYELVLSGDGLVRIYEFLREQGKYPETTQMKQALQSDEDQAAVISRFASERHDELAMASLEVFVRIYGAQAGNFALNCLATGGVYIAGGIAPKIIDKLHEGEFLKAFRAKGNMSHLMHDMPVKVIMNEQVGLLGAADYAAKMLD